MWKDEGNVEKLIDELVKLFFVYTPPALILKGKISDNCFPQKQFEELMRCYVKEYSDTESKLIYQFQNLREQNVYHTLFNVAHELLVVKNDQVCCKFEELLRWREVSRYLGEDLLVCAFGADQFLKYGKRWKDFTWKLVIGHNNKQLNAILKQGISDNHFHLFGSAPIFPLVWIRMMNDIHHGKYMISLMGIQNNRRKFQYHLSDKYEEYTPNVLSLQAALMRALMYSALLEKGKKGANWEKIGNLYGLLQLGADIVHVQHELRDFVESLRLTLFFPNEEEVPDYAIEGRCDQHKYSDWLFSGERKLVYEMLCDIMVNNMLPEQIQRLLYPYLVIRTWFRGEMVQNNENIGFDNFGVYSSRKKILLNALSSRKDKEIYWQAKERMQNLKWAVQHAVLESFQPMNLQSLEIRITPCNDFRDDVDQIQCIDKLLIGEEIRRGIRLTQNQFFYIYHFSKRRESNSFQEVIIPVERNHEVRKSLVCQAKAIRKMRKIRPEVAKRVHGIDACAMEIGCRPEVFACAFRYLKEDVSFIVDHETILFESKKYDTKNIEYSGKLMRDRWIDNDFELPQLAVTYHVGEDFLDAIDGLRALDEAIHFLCMGHGDRFGHATVLGLSLHKWYEKKHYRIYLPLHDYLDNVVWFYQKIIEYQIDGCEMLKDYLLEEYLKTYQQIYGQNNQPYHMDIFTYYEAWKLRGDKPELYASGVYIKPDIFEQGLYLTTPDFPEDKSVRENKIIANLYFRYHYDQTVREKGSQPMEKNVPQMYVDGAIKLQKCMQREIAQIGIGIETNPSSNLAISTMDNYVDHPILNLYTMGLKNDKDAAQMFVSINTDDRGVFHTSLENEYALLASSVENVRDENGKKIFTPQEVYDWLDRIRIMGNQQVFKL